MYNTRFGIRDMTKVYEKEGANERKILIPCVCVVCDWMYLWMGNFFLKGKLQLHEWFWLLGNTPPIITDMRPINALRERESEPEHSVRNTLYYIYTIIHMQWWCAIESIERNASPYVILNLVNGTFILFLEYIHIHASHTYIVCALTIHAQLCHFHIYLPLSNTCPKSLKCLYSMVLCKHSLCFNSFLDRRKNE